MRLSGLLRAGGSDVKLFDALGSSVSHTLTRKRASVVTLDGVKVNIWRFGVPEPKLRRDLISLREQGWYPEAIVVEAMSSVWWQGAKEVIELAREAFPSSRVSLVGAYATEATRHARANTDAESIWCGLPIELVSAPVDIEVFDRKPSFSPVWLNPLRRSAADVVEEIRSKHRLWGVREFSFADLAVTGDEAGLIQFKDVLDLLAEEKLRLRFFATGNLAPEVIANNVGLAHKMAHVGYSEIHFADDRHKPLSPEAEAELADVYDAVAVEIASAGFDPRKALVSGSVSVGRLGEDIRGRSRLLTRISGSLGSLVVWPYQPLPDECPGVPLEDTNGRLFPFRHANGVTFRDYLDVAGLAAVLSSKYRQRSFDFLGDGLIPAYMRRSLSNRSWEPPDGIKGELKVAVNKDRSTSPGNRRPEFVIPTSARRSGTTEIVTESTFSVTQGPAGHRRALLINPPVYDAQYWARWSQPAGLLRIAQYLKSHGYLVDLLDCMETDSKGYVAKSTRRIGGQPLIVERDDVLRPIYHFGLKWEDFVHRLQTIAEPDEVWISSTMTYWWESTRDAVNHIRSVFPKALIIVGGVYPTLAPNHAAEKLGADVVFVGELSEASGLSTDLSLYTNAPSYSILTTSRGCPWECSYCAARALNGGSNRMRPREPEEVLEEIEYKMKRFGIRRFGFYEDNALALRGHLQRILELIIERGLKLELYAPEGFETRLLTVELLRTMRQAGFRKVHLPFEALHWETNLNWNRRHASTASFERALSAAIDAGFRPRTEEINAFVLFGLPDDSIERILDGVLYVHHMVGSIIPMLFTPVPGTRVYAEFEEYLTGTSAGSHGWDLQDLNGKFLPFLEYNQLRYPQLRASDYLQLERLMSILNSGKVLRRSFDLCDESLASTSFRQAVHDFASERKVLSPCV